MRVKLKKERKIEVIVREEETAFVMIQQHHHAAISAEVMEQYREVFFAKDALAATVIYAIRQHDRGWRLFDEEPYWNDEKQAPYAFTDFPGKPKIVLYRQGINEVEKQSPYAALLCSAHYMNFVKRQSGIEAERFLAQERKRGEQIRASLSFYDPEQFAKHLGLLQLADHLSLYICLNRAGVTKEFEHPFFKDGISIATSIPEVAVEKIGMCWKDDKTVQMKGLPPVPDFTVTLKQKRLEKQAIQINSLRCAYAAAPVIAQQINFQCH